MKATVDVVIVRAMALVVLLVATSAHAGRISFEAVEVNGSAITPTHSLTVTPGDTVVCEIFASDWSAPDDLLYSWQVSLDASGFTNGGAGIARPLGWDRPVPAVLCSEDNDCPSAYPTCASDARCAGPGYDAEQGAFIDTTRLDYVFVGSQNLTAVDVSRLDYRYSAGLFFANTCRAYVGEPRYLGTLILQIEDDACGVFVVDAIEGPGNTELLACDSSNLPVEVERLTLDTGSSCFRPFSFCMRGPNATPDPARCGPDVLSVYDGDQDGDVDLSDYAGYQTE